jgi:hypothetical protein
MVVVAVVNAILVIIGLISENYDEIAPPLLHAINKHYFPAVRPVFAAVFVVETIFAVNVDRAVVRSTLGILDVLIGAIGVMSLVLEWTNAHTMFHHVCHDLYAFTILKILILAFKRRKEPPVTLPKA